MLPGAPAVELYGCNDPAFPDCKQPAGSRCVNKKGTKVAPHPKRWNLGQGYADAWNKRQVEIDNLTHARDEAYGDAARAEDAAEALEKENAALRARIDELENPPVEPAPQTKFGACVLTTTTAVPAKLGAGAVVRLFQSTPGPFEIPAGSLVHVSAHDSLGTAAALDAWLSHGGLRTFKHEPDNDKMTPEQIAAWKAEHNRLYDHNVTQGRPCLIVPTFTGSFWSNHTTDEQRAVWLDGLRADLYGLDFDGVHDNQTTKPADLTYRVGKAEITNVDEIAALQRAMAKYGVPGYCVPEFGTSRRPWDTDGAGRTKWMKENAQRFIDSTPPAVYAAWFDEQANGKDDRIIEGSLEHAALKELVAR